MKRFLCGVLAALMLVVLCACGKQETATVRLSEVTHSVFYAPQLSLIHISEPTRH